VEKSADFYKNVVGMEMTETPNQEIAFLSCSRDHHNVILQRSNQPGLKRVAFEMENSQELENAVQILAKAGVKVWEVEQEERFSLRIGKAYRFRDPNGMLLEFYDRMLYRADSFSPHPIKILKLDHVVIRVPDIESSVDFYENTMNFKISDYRFKPTGEKTFAFMRCFPNPYHHSFGISQGESLKLFHLAFKVSDIDDIGSGRNRFLHYNVPVVFGPGRHLASGSIFMYYLDPDGLTLEYTLGMEEFPESNPRPPRMLDNSLKTTDLWEGAVDPRIGKVGHIEID
jgi:2,3-dihydroxy-p-cumate/2,3-dihydroxybenzoate 3,4-dioxygenase